MSPEEKLMKIREICLKNDPGRKTLSEIMEETNYDTNPYEASGGNFDDCYYMGQIDGAAELARGLLGICDS